MATQLGDTLSPSRSLVHEKGAGLSFLAVNGASVCSQHQAPWCVLRCGFARLHWTTWEDPMQMKGPEWRCP